MLMLNQSHFLYLYELNLFRFLFFISKTNWHFSWNNLAIGFFLRCNKFRRQSGIWRKKIFGSVITQLTEPLFDSDHDLGEMVEENSVPIQRQNLVRYCTHPKRQKSIDFLYHFNLFIFFIYFVQNLFFLMVCKRRSYFAMVPVKEVDSTSPPPLHLVPLPSFIKILKFSYIL